MTTSFALLVRGDVWNSLKANAVGTLLAVFCLALIPWCIICSVHGRPLWIVSIERTLTVLIVAFVVLMLLRWGIVLGLAWWNGEWSRGWGNSEPRPSSDSRRGDD